jgi:FkbM family methyltransferase
MEPSHTEPVTYYLDNRGEFGGEEGHEELVKRLEGIIPLRSTSVIAIDVGGNIGGEMETIDKLCPEEKTVLVIEPNPVNITELHGKFDSREDVVIIPMAVSDTKRVGNFYNHPGISGNPIGNAQAGLDPITGAQKICSVNITTLDSLLKHYPDHPIKYIKIDTEGHDTRVIRGMGNNLHRVDYLVFEASDCLDDERGPKEETPLQNIVEFLDSRGFDVYRIGTKRLLKLNGEMWDEIYEKVKFWSNCFAMKKENLVRDQLIDSKGYFL